MNSEHKIAMAEIWGREMAREEFRKTAKQDELQSLAEDMMKSANIMGMLGNLGGIGAKALGAAKSFAPTALNFAKQNPGAVIGAGLGAAHGLMKRDGGVGAGLMEGAMGGLAGYGVQKGVGMLKGPPSGRVDMKSIMGPSRPGVPLTPPNVQDFTKKPGLFG